MTLGSLDVNMVMYPDKSGEVRVARKKAEYKTGNYSSGASLGREQKLRAADEMRLYTNPVEHEYLVLGLDPNGLGYEA
jgi:hypothetical protein